MDSDKGKLFIGGISGDTDKDKLKEYFGVYGEVAQTVVMRDKVTGKTRGFGFVVFADPDILDKVLQDKHVIGGRTVEVKRAKSKEEKVLKTGNSVGPRNSGGVDGGRTRTKKIFVGGLPPTLSEDSFKQYFEPYGTIIDFVIMGDKQTNRSRGFGFISFDSEDAVDMVLEKTFHNIGGKQVEVKRALPKDGNSGGGDCSVGGNSGGSQGHRYSASNSSPYEVRTQQSSYIQPRNSPGPYGYNASGYGYKPANAGMGYGNPNAPGSGYGSVHHPGAGRGGWGPQSAPPYGYRVGPVSGMGQSANGASGYGNRGYGGIDGGYGNQAANGNQGYGGWGPLEDMQSGSGGGYRHNSGWKYDPSQYGGYGGGST